MIVKVDANDLETTLDKLDTKTKYYINIRAIDERGTGPLSDTITLTTGSGGASTNIHLK
jgi:hypothetical protein